MSTVFLTGFPGFLGSQLLPRLLGRAPGGQAVCLVNMVPSDFVLSAIEHLGALPGSIGKTYNWPIPLR